MKRKLICILLFFATIGCLLCQEENIKFDRISIEQGLSQSIVSCIIQDKRGFIWLGTEDGLNKYDGYDFTIYRQDPSIPNSLSHNNILCIHEDRSGKFWIGTFYGGLTCLDPATMIFTHYRSNSSTSSKISNDMVRTIYEDNSGILWLGTEEGLNSFDRSTGIFKLYNFTESTPGSISNNKINAIIEDYTGKLWVGTENGLNVLDKKSGKFESFFTIPGNSNSLSSNFIQSLYIDHTGVLWIGTQGGGLNQYIASKKIFKSFIQNPKNQFSISNNDIYSIYEDRFGKFWIGTNYGLNKFDRNENKFYAYYNDTSDPNSLSNNNIRSIFEDNSGVIWIGTYGGGISKFDGKKKKFLHYQRHPAEAPNTLSNDIVWSIWEDKSGYLWIGTHGGGLDKFDRKKNLFTHYRNIPGDTTSLSNNIVRLVFEDSMGTMWIGTDSGGLNKFDKEKGKFKRFQNRPGDPTSISHNSLRSIYEDKEGTMWIGTYGGGLNKFDRQNEIFTTFRNNPNNPKSLCNDFVRCIYEDSKKNFWIGTQGGGLDKFDPNSSTFTHFKNQPTNPFSLSNDFVFAIYEDSFGELWICTWGGGLNRFDRNKNIFYHFGTADGLPHNAIYGILEDNNGNLWLSTNNGLCRFNPRKMEFKNYTEKDGLQSNEFNGGTYFKSKTGEMFFGGINGFNAFYPNQIKESSFIPPIIITSFLKKNKEVKLNSPIYELSQLQLYPGDYFFSFEFASLDYTAPQKNLYMYKMDGLDKEWIHTDARKRFASYTTLEPGTYTFMVRGTNSDGVWNKEGASIKIMIKPPLYKTWGFRVSVISLILLFFFYLHRTRTNRLTQVMEKKRLEKELRLKADFTAMLVHDLRSPLTAVMGYAELMKDNPTKTDKLKIANIISRSSEKMLHLINDMLDFSKFEAGKMTLNLRNINISTVVMDAVEIMMPLFNQKELQPQFEIEPEVKQLQLSADSDKIAQVVNNFLSNAVKFSPPQNSITIRVTKLKNGYVEISVTDHGPGVPQDRQILLFDKYAQLENELKQKGTGLGLAVSKMIVESHGGIIGYRPLKNEKGSTFFFQLPSYH